MSYDMRFDCGPIDHHGIKGGTYALGGTCDPSINITYNYSQFFYAHWPSGIRELYGKTAKDVVREIERVLPKMSGSPDSDYWASTEGNAKAALIGLRDLANLCPEDSVLSGD